MRNRDPRTLFWLILPLGIGACAPRLEVEPEEVLVIPEERVPLRVQVVDSSGAATPVDLQEATVSALGASGTFGVDQGKPVVRLFGEGDIENLGSLSIGFEGLMASVPFRLYAPEGVALTLVEDLLGVQEEAIADYVTAVSEFGEERQTFEATQQALESATAASETVIENFQFLVSWGMLQPPGTPKSIPLDKIVDAFTGLEVAASEAFFRLIDDHVTLTLLPSSQTQGTSGLIPCPQGLNCYRIATHLTATLNAPSQPAASDAEFQLHTAVGSQSITALSASYVDGSAPAAGQVLYVVEPPIWCGSVLDSSGTIAITDGCNDPAAATVTTELSGGDALVWTLDSQTNPREQWILENTAQFRIGLGVSRYADLGDAEAAALRAFEGMVRAQADLAARKVEAMEALAVAEAELNRATGHVQEFWSDRLRAMLDDLKGEVNRLHDEVQDLPDLDDETKGDIADLKSKWDTGANVAELALVMAKADDPNLSVTDRLRAVKDVFDIGRKLGPGGPMVEALAPFFDFYSEAMGEIADALDRIDELRKEQVLSTDNCEIIESLFIDPNDPRIAEWQNACKLRRLMQKVRDP